MNQGNMDRIKEIGLIDVETKTQFEDLLKRNTRSDDEIVDSIIREGLSYYLENEEAVRKVEEDKLVEDNLTYSGEILDLLYYLSEFSDNLEQAEIKSALIRKGLENRRRKGSKLFNIPLGKT